MNIYLAGPMRGIKDFNFPAFHLATAHLRAQGHFVFSPAERDVEEFGEARLKTAHGCEFEVAANLGMDRLAMARNCFLHDTHFICAMADAVYLLPGWETSRGAKAERALAEAIGLAVVEL